MVERLALLLQASVLLRAASPVARAFCTGRLRHGGRVFGTLPADVDGALLLERALG